MSTLIGVPLFQWSSPMTPVDSSQESERFVSDVAFTPAVKAQQERLGSRPGYARMESGKGWADRITPDLAAFVAARDSVYLATASAVGQPYIQHRGGPPGFLKVLDERTLGFADFRGNRQYITLGNISENDRAAIFLVDYANRRRVKLWGRLAAVEDDPGLIERLMVPGYQAKPERALLFRIEAWDANCPQHIVPRYSEAELRPAFERLQARILELEAEVARLKAVAAAG
jgi:predicted pyridoxine 5'-phosphate oxidase superfamily flavin-nucleotide-binding protein